MWHASEEGTPQGGLLSPLLSNIMLNELDKELNHRGHPLVRYADDLMIFCKSKHAAERVRESITKFIEGKLFLKVNKEKIVASYIKGVKYLGYSFYVHKGKCQLSVHLKSKAKMKSRLKELTSRSNGWGYEKRKQKLKEYIQGWVGYYHLANMKRFCQATDEWLRRRIRMCIWKGWKLPKGFNDALWFMGNNDRPWPANGEIDLLENPKKKVNNRAHFTLHSENHYAGVMGGKGSVTATVDLKDMSEWNIYWLEWYPDRIVGGVNGEAYFTHTKGVDGNLDWPWSDPAGFYLIFSTGLSTNPKSWPGVINPAEWKKDGGPDMCIDWVRVYVNDAYQGTPAPAVKFY